MTLRRGKFNADDLQPVDTSRIVILNSGGPLLTVECVEGNNAICTWKNDNGQHAGRAMFPVACLSRLVRWNGKMD